MPPSAPPHDPNSQRRESSKSQPPERTLKGLLFSQDALPGQTGIEFVPETIGGRRSSLWRVAVGERGAANAHRHVVVYASTAEAALFKAYGRMDDHEVVRLASLIE